MDLWLRWNTCAVQNNKINCAVNIEMQSLFSSSTFLYFFIFCFLYITIYYEVSLITLCYLLGANALLPTHIYVHDSMVTVSRFHKIFHCHVDILLKYVQNNNYDVDYNKSSSMFLRYICVNTVKWTFDTDVYK